MSFNVVYQPDARSLAAAAQQVGQGERAERDLDRARQDQQRQQDMAFQAAQQQQSQQADLQRQMLGAQVENAQTQRDFAMNRYARHDDNAMQMDAEQQQQAGQLARAKTMADYNAGLERQALDQKMTAADRAEANRIDNDRRAIESDTTLHPEQKQQLLTAAGIRDQTLRAKVASQVSQIKPRFADLPPERQPGQPPWPAQNQQGQPLMREVYDEQGNVVGKEPVMMITNDKGVAEPFKDPVAEKRRDDAAKARQNQLRAQQDDQKQFATFAGTIMKSLVDEDGNIPQGAEDRVMSMWEKMQAKRTAKAPQGQQQGQQPSAQPQESPLPPAARDLLQKNNQKAPVKISSPDQIKSMNLAPGTVVELNGKHFAVAPKRPLSPVTFFHNEPSEGPRTMEYRYGRDDQGPGPSHPVYRPGEDTGPGPQQLSQ